MVILLFFLTLFFVNLVWPMEQQKPEYSWVKESEKEVFNYIEQIKDDIDFNNIDASLEKISTSIQNNTIQNALKYHMTQWNEIASLPCEVKKICAAGSTVAWLNVKKPKKFYYITDDSDKHCSGKIESIEPIEHIDVSPSGLKLALTVGNKLFIWNIFKKIMQICIPSTYISNITALTFFRNDKVIIGRNDGTVYIQSLKKTTTPNFKFSNCAIAIVARSIGGITIIYDQEGNIGFFKRTKGIPEPRQTTPAKLTNMGILRKIIPLGFANFVASDSENTVYCMEMSNDFMKVDGKRFPDIGNMVGVTSCNSFITYELESKVDTQLKAIVDQLAVILKKAKGISGREQDLEEIQGILQSSSFKLYSAEGKCIDTITALKSIQPIFCKSQILSDYKDWAPKYLFYKKTGKSMLLKKQQATAQQLAFRCMLLKAKKDVNDQAMTALLNHEQLKSFGKYMRKLFKIYCND